MKAEIVKLGSLYFDDRPVCPGAAYDGEALFFEDTATGYELQWVKDGNMLIADRCVCINISWEQLEQMGFIFGAPITIDGKPYLCRCLKVGDKKGAPNEWDSLLARYGEDNQLWHWNDMCFWGQETPPNWASYRAVRGYSSARRWINHRATTRLAFVGFRPVLEPLFSELTEVAVGSNIKAFGPNGEAIKGKLAGLDDYDLVLSSGAKVPKDCAWAIRQGEMVIASRRNIIGIGGMQS